MPLNVPFSLTRELSHSTHSASLLSIYITGFPFTLTGAAFFASGVHQAQAGAGLLGKHEQACSTRLGEGHNCPDAGSTVMVLKGPGHHVDTAKVKSLLAWHQLCLVASHEC